jgi:hypothetical protein
MEIGLTSLAQTRPCASAMITSVSVCKRSTDIRTDSDCYLVLPSKPNAILYSYAMCLNAADQKICFEWSCLRRSHTTGLTKAADDGYLRRVGTFSHQCQIPATRRCIGWNNLPSAICSGFTPTAGLRSAPASAATANLVPGTPARH